MVATKKTGKRVGATTIASLSIFGIDFVEGDEKFNKKDVNAMVGTYWYDPVEFTRKIVAMEAQNNINKKTKYKLIIEEVDEKVDEKVDKLLKK